MQPNKDGKCIEPVFKEEHKLDKHSNPGLELLMKDDSKK